MQLSTPQSADPHMYPHVVKFPQLLPPHTDLHLDAQLSWQSALHPEKQVEPQKSTGLKSPVLIIISD